MTDADLPRRSFDLDRHPLLHLLGTNRAVALIAPSGPGVVGWHYDPRNQVFTPTLTCHATAGEALWHAAIHLLGKPEVSEELGAALDMARAASVATKTA